jgi:hypothetical protein
MSKLISRRESLRQCGLVAFAVMMTRQSSAGNANKPSPGDPASGGAVHVDPNDEMAIALAYHESSAAVNAKQFSTYEPGQQCGNCIQSTGAADAEWRSCALFRGKLVNAHGWCEGYYKRP